MNESDSILIKYMVESFDHSQPASKKFEGKPFITISRDFGCQANTIARMLKEAFQKKGQKWSILNKEIIMESARKLEMDPRQVKEISESTDRTVMDEVLSALSQKYYKSDRKIRQTIASVVTSAAADGHAIIVGRAGAAITQALTPSIHIKLFAPIEWRLASLMQRYHASREHMMKQITSTDLSRHKMMSQVVKGNENIHELYDLHINCSKLTHQQIVAVIMQIAEDKFKR